MVKARSSGDRGGVWSGRLRGLDAIADAPDSRDRLYAPPLAPLRPRIEPWEDGRDWWSHGRIRDQRRDPSCVGFALAAAIDHLRVQSLLQNGRAVDLTVGFDRPWVSARMLYETAKFHDEWQGEGYRGSSLRGGIKGFFYNGVCTHEEAERAEREDYLPAGDEDNEEVPDRKPSWFMTRQLLESARTIQLGAYYRVRPRLADMHAALNEAGVVLVTASLHAGWLNPGRADPDITYEPAGGPSGQSGLGLHAFILVGYDDKGFWVQNSWGTRWGRGGLARWRYEDWGANVADAWVLHLAVIPQSGEAAIPSAGLTAFSARIEAVETHFLDTESRDISGPSRLDVLGHLIPFRDGWLDRYGPYNTDRATLRHTADLIERRLADDRVAGGSNLAGRGVVLPREHYKYRHVLLYFLGGWGDEHRLAAELKRVVPTFKRHGVYPLFIAWEIALFHELELLVRRAIGEVAEAGRNTARKRQAPRDRRIEGRLAGPANRVLREIRASVRQLFTYREPDPDLLDGEPLAVPGAGPLSLRGLFRALAPRYRRGSIDYHMVAHGFGAQLLAECLAWRGEEMSVPGFASCTLISPLVALDRAMSDIFAATSPHEPGRRKRRLHGEQIEVDKLRLLLLDDTSLTLDRFSDGYAGSWPELWSRVAARDDNVRNAGARKMRRREVAYGANGAPDELCLLGIARHAAKDIARETAAGSSIEHWSIRQTKADDNTSLHHALGLHPSILSFLLPEREPGDPHSGAFPWAGPELLIERLDPSSLHRGPSLGTATSRSRPPYR